jgi:hypothetical protein
VRWRDIRFENPTKADADDFGEVLMLHEDQSVAAVQYDFTLMAVAWMPIFELPKFEPIPDPPEPKYRPFVNAIEFHRYRDRWIATPGSKILRRVDHYNDLGVNGMAWESLFRNRTFEDGSPCGVEVSE